ncbi:MAG: outer membrane lipoprotein LolB [Gammaproteobacteria bacterium]|nr:outer membrane lipoprotein LolB [Gammaproteobacteria bacterium]NNM20199.1 outer membrane lipoprotein LolB [Gammaproteobacteria bacterium]
MRGFLPVLLLCVAGCVPGQRGDAPADWVSRSAALAELPAWSLDGRIALQVGQRGFNGALSWQQAGDEMSINFRGPLGAGAFRVTGTTGALVLESANGDTYLLDDPQGTLSAELGWGVPLDALRYWVIGLPHPAYEARESFDPTGRLATLEQLDWRVLYERYQAAGDWEMPRKIRLHNGDQVSIRIVISRWSL